MNVWEPLSPPRRGAGIMNCRLRSPSSSMRRDVLSELCSARSARATSEKRYLPRPQPDA